METWQSLQGLANPSLEDWKKQKQKKKQTNKKKTKQKNNNPQMSLFPINPCHGE